MALTDRGNALFLDRFERQVELSPTAPAARFGSEEMTYTELEAASSALATELLDRGVGANSLVPIMVGRSLDLPVAILGVVRSGAAYVPIDRRWPAARMREVFAQVGAPIAIVDAGHAELLPPGCPSLHVEEIPRRGRREMACPEPGDAAYVMFTSGSTGAPKGILVEHRALSRFLAWAREYFHLGPSSRVIQFSPLTFDASIWEIFGTFSSGGTLVLVPEDVVESPQRLSRAMSEFGITHCDIVPSVLAMLDADQAPQLSQCMAGGERIPRELVARWATAERTFVNGYGPAEATVVSIAARCGADESGPVPIGNPICGVEVYLLDDALSPTPPGETGEIFLGGETLARGYIGMPRETAERFLPDPFAAVAGGRMYRTGDLARQLDDGTFFFVGRRDLQVKIAGQRVEPEEAEAALRAVPGVTDCAVVVVERRSRPRLAGFFTGDVSPADARRGCEARLPRHVVPSSFQLLARLPLGPTGKIDRSALLAMVAEDPEGQPVPGGRPDTARLFIEAVVDVLGSAERDRSFVEAGGDSLDAMRVLSRLPPDLSRKLTVRGILQAASLEEVCGTLEAYSVGTSKLPVIEPGAPEPWPLSEAQLGLLLAHELEPDRPTYNVSVALEFDGALDVEALDEAIRRLGFRQQTLSRRIERDPIRGTAVARLDPSLTISLEDVGSGESAEVDALLRGQAQRPFILDTEVPSRFIYAASETPSHRLLVTTHHLAADGWSVSVLLENLAQHYADVLAGTESLAPLEISFGDYAAWESRLLAAGTIRRDAETWRTRLDPFPRVLRLGSKPSTGDLRVPPGTRQGVDLALSPETVGAVQALAASHKVSPFMVLLTAFSQVVGDRSGLDRFLIGCPMATRFDWRLEGVVGHLVNLLPIPIELGRDATFATDLRRVGEAAHESYRLRHVSLGQIVKEMRLAREERWRPLIQVAFQIEDDFRLPRFPGLNVALDEIPPQSIGLDLECRLVSREGGLAGTLNFDASIYSEPEIKLLASEFETIVRACTSDTQ
jgi:amino acid adenylation domain-containing protein